MKRLLLVAVLALGVALVLAGSAGAAPSNKNASPITVFCDNGKTYSAVSNDRANVNGAIHVLGVGIFKLVTFDAFDPETHEFLFGDTSNFPKPANISCNGTFTGVDPDGEEFTIDFTVTGYLRSK
jgi:hypothetical protein